MINSSFAVQALECLELEEEKKDLINREIRSFRDAHKVQCHFIRINYYEYSYELN